MLKKSSITKYSNRYFPRCSTTSKREGAFFTGGSFLFLLWMIFSPGFIFAQPNLVSGQIYLDANNDCTWNPGERTFPNMLVRVEPGPLYTTTDEAGVFQIEVAAGMYQLSLAENLDKYKVKFGCPAGSPYSHTIPLTGSGGASLDNDFPLVVDTLCPSLWVETSTAGIVPGQSSEYILKWANWGTDVSYGTQIKLAFSNGLSLTSADSLFIPVPPGFPSPFDHQDSAIFELGTVFPGESGTMTLQISADNTLSPGLAKGIVASISPSIPCEALSSDWNGAHIEVEGGCKDNDTLTFRVRNTGTDIWSGKTGTIGGGITVVEDIILKMDTLAEIAPGDELNFKFPANGKTWTLIAEQATGHPGQNRPLVSVEGCGTDSSGNFDTGKYTIWPENDEDAFVAHDVKELSSSGPVTGIQVFPGGIKDNFNWIATETALEYHFVFENHYPDTLHTVMIRDTLPPELDLSALQMGPSSHPYEYTIHGEGVLDIWFYDIGLPPVSSPSSNAKLFVKFKLPQVPYLPHGTRIENTATVYNSSHNSFALNSVFNTISNVNVGVGSEAALSILVCDSVLICLGSEYAALEFESNLKLGPNPVMDVLNMEFICPLHQRINLEIVDMQGRIIHSKSFTPGVYQYEYSFPEKSRGIYFVRFSSPGRFYQTRKVQLIRH